MKAILRLTLFISVATLGACTTSYGPKSYWNGGGYTEARLRPGEWQVWFDCNVRVSDEWCEDLALLRGADLCLAEGKPFLIAGQYKTDFTYVGLAPARTTVRRMGADGQLETAANGGYPATPAGYSFKSGGPRYRALSAVRVECVDAQVGEAQDAAAAAARIRALYKIEPRRTPNSKIVPLNRRDT